MRAPRSIHGMNFRAQTHRHRHKMLPPTRADKVFARQNKTGPWRVWTWVSPIRSWGEERE
jgi:hypothetical protein